MHEIIEKYPNKRVLIVTHNEVKASAIQQLIHPDMPNDYYSSSVSILEYENDMWDYISLNDISHLLPDERVD
jgi:broad specificity phosphatase PhoE